MVNQKLRGINYERKLVNEARSKGIYASRSSASLGIFDVITIDTINKEIVLIQAKCGKKLTKPQITEIYNNGRRLEGLYSVKFVLKQKCDMNDNL